MSMNKQRISNWLLLDTYHDMHRIDRFPMFSFVCSFVCVCFFCRKILPMNSKVDSKTQLLNSLIRVNSKPAWMCQRKQNGTKQIKCFICTRFLFYNGIKVILINIIRMCDVFIHKEISKQINHSIQSCKQLIWTVDRGWQPQHQPNVCCVLVFYLFWCRCHAQSKSNNVRTFCQLVRICALCCHNKHQTTSS